MESDSIPLLIALGILLLLSAFFSASETAFSSLNRVRLKSMAADGNAGAARALVLTTCYDKLLSSILVGNNIVNIASSSVATVLFVGWFGSPGVTIATIVTTVLVLVFGEVSPKTLAKESPEKFAMFSAPILRVLMAIFTPINAALSAFTRLLLRLFRVKGSHNTTEQELLTFVEEVRQDGGINEQEEQMIRSAIEFDDLQAIAIATPRVDIRAVPLESTLEEISELFLDTGYSRLPVYENTLDEIKGVLLDKDFYHYVLPGTKQLDDVVRPALFITKGMKISALLKELQQNRIHMAVLVDEYGGTLGIVTVEDIVEELVGEIWDEHDQIRQDITPLADGRYRILGGAEVDELFNLYDISDEPSSITVGGWVAEQLGHIPEKGESFRFGNMQLTVEETRRHRVVSVLAQLCPPEAEE